MGFLKYSSSGPNLNKATVSLWYRIPAASSSAVRAFYEGYSAFDYYGMTGVVPLLVFGVQNPDIVYDFGTRHIHHDGNFGAGNANLDFDVPMVDGNHTSYTPPSFIGIAFRGGADDDNRLIVNLQTSDFLVAAGSVEAQTTDINYEDVTVPGSPLVYTTEDISYVLESIAASFQGVGGFDCGALDVWHHLLISWDVGDEEIVISDDGVDHEDVSPFVTTDAKMYVALDDINKNGDDLPADWLYQNDDVPTGDPNRIVLAQIMAKAGQTFQDNGSSLTCSISDVPTSPICIPADATTLLEDGSSNTPVQKIELARVQVYAGVALDTSDQDVRRAFITSDLRPASLSLARALTGRIPVVEFDKAVDIIAGRNSGSTGNFTSTGTISAFTPGPGF